MCFVRFRIVKLYLKKKRLCYCNVFINLDVFNDCLSISTLGTVVNLCCLDIILLPNRYYLALAISQLLGMMIGQIMKDLISPSAR